MIVAEMRQEVLWEVDAAQRYGTPGMGMFASEVLGPTVDRLAELPVTDRRSSSPSGRVESRSRLSSGA